MTATSAESPGADRRSLAPRVVVLWRAVIAVVAVVATAVSIVVPVVLGGGWWLLPVAVAVVGAVVVVYQPAARYRAWSWLLGDQALELRHGLWNRVTRTLPYFRIQHIDVEHGPLDRRLGLARLEVHTASVTAVLPGLAADEAPAIRERLLEFAADAAAGADGDVDAV